HRARKRGFGPASRNPPLHRWCRRLATALFGSPCVEQTSRSVLPAARDSAPTPAPGLSFELLPSHDALRERSFPITHDVQWQSPVPTPISPAGAFRISSSYTAGEHAWQHGGDAEEPLPRPRAITRAHAVASLPETGQRAHAEILVAPPRPVPATAARRRTKALLTRFSWPRRPEAPSRPCPACAGRDHGQRNVH